MVRVVELAVKSNKVLRGWTLEGLYTWILYYQGTQDSSSIGESRLIKELKMLEKIGKYARVDGWM